MPRPSSPHPTQLELEMLKILWREGPLSVRKVRDALAAEGRRLAHTSVITVLNIMTAKSYLKRSKRGIGFVYAPKIARQKTVGGMLKDLLDRAFAGSPTAALLNLLEAGDVTDAEMKELRDLIAVKAKENRS